MIRTYRKVGFGRLRYPGKAESTLGFGLKGLGVSGPQSETLNPTKPAQPVLSYVTKSHARQQSLHDNHTAILKLYGDSIA